MSRLLAHKVQVYATITKHLWCQYQVLKEKGNAWGRISNIYHRKEILLKIFLQGKGLYIQTLEGESFLETLWITILWARVFTSVHLKRILVLSLIFSMAAALRHHHLLNHFQGPLKREEKGVKPRANSRITQNQHLTEKLKRLDRVKRI